MILLLAFHDRTYPAVAVATARGAPATIDAMMHMHEEFNEVLNRVFDGPADVLVGTKASLGTHNPAPD